MRTQQHDREAVQLGLNPSTARHLLKRNIIYFLAKKAGLGVCFACGKDIENPEDISIEHKISWYGNNTNLFWDMENIAFSHKKCNKPRKHILFINDRKESGKVRCSRCKQQLPPSFFRGKRYHKRPDKLQSYCKDCTREYINLWRSGRRKLRKIP